jgi:hypothetical protein
MHGELTTQIGLNRLNKFRFMRTRIGNEKARCPKRSSEKLNGFCPSGESVCSNCHLAALAQACGWALAHAHAKASEISATISGYLGGSSDAFDAAMGQFALAYADQAERDHAALRAAVRNGKIGARHGF